MNGVVFYGWNRYYIKHAIYVQSHNLGRPFVGVTTTQNDNSLIITLVVIDPCPMQNGFLQSGPICKSSRIKICRNTNACDQIKTLRSMNNSPENKCDNPCLRYVSRDVRQIRILQMHVYCKFQGLCQIDYEASFKALQLARMRWDRLLSSNDYWYVESIELLSNSHSKDDTRMVVRLTMTRGSKKNRPMLHAFN